MKEQIEQLFSNKLIHDCTTMAECNMLKWSEPSSKWHVCSGQPWASSYEITHSKFRCLWRTSYHMIATPINPAARRWTRSSVLVLSIVQSLEGKIAIPLKPPSWVNQSVQVTLQKNRAWILLPRSTQVCLDRTEDRFEVWPGHDTGVVNRNARVLIRVGPALCRDCVLLTVRGPSCVDHAVLEDDSGVAKNEVDGAVHVALFVELSLRVDVEGVLVAFEATTVENWEVSAWSEGYGLMVLWTSCVAECDATSNEAISSYRCN